MNRSLPATPNLRGLGAALTLTFASASLFVGAAVAQAPLTLSEAIATVRKNSDETRLIAEKSRKLDAQKTELWAGALPNISAYANAGRGAQPFDLGSLGFNDTSGGSTVLNPAQNRYRYGIQGTQPIFSFGRLGNAFRTANLQIKSQDAANRRSTQELELQTLDAYYAVVLSEARLKVISASLERQTKTFGFLESNFKRGAGSRSTLLLTSASLKALEPERIRAERDADAARMNLNRLLGRPEGDPLIVDTASVALAEDNGSTTTGSGNVDKVVENRPDIQSLHLLQQTTQGIARAYRMQYLPALGATGQVGIMAYKLDEQMTDFDHNLEWSIGIGLTWPLFDGFANSSKARQYDSDARSLAINERKARAYARIEIESARREADAADTALSAAQQSRNASAEALDLIGQDFRAGSGNVTDLLSAEEGLRAAESGLLAARYQKARAKAALRVAMGMNLTEGESK